MNYRLLRKLLEKLELQIALSESTEKEGDRLSVCAEKLINTGASEKLLNEYENANCLYVGGVLEDSFLEGFKLGVRLIAECLL